MKNKYEFFLIGTGATGSQLLPMFTQLLNNTNHTNLTLVDGDVVETKNLKNQKFLQKDVGYYKAEVLAERYQRVYPDLLIKYIPEYIKNEELILHLLQSTGYNTIPVIIACVDNVETRKIICEAITKFSNDNLYIYIDSGNGTLERNGQIVVSTNLDEMQYKLPWDIFSKIKESTNTIDNALSCGNQTDKNPQNIATNLYAAVNLFMVLTNLIMFNKIDKNFIKFDAENIDCVSRSIQ